MKTLPCKYGGYIHVCSYMQELNICVLSTVGFSQQDIKGSNYKVRVYNIQCMKGRLSASMVYDIWLKMFNHNNSAKVKGGAPWYHPLGDIEGFATFIKGLNYTYSFVYNI